MTASLQVEHAELLEHVELFPRLERLSRAKLAAYVEPIALEDRQAVFRQGDPGDGLYIVTRGTLAVSVVSSEAQDLARVNTLGP